MKLKAVIFDMDGTMVNNLSFHIDAWLQFLKKNNIVVESQNFETQIYGTAREMITRLFGREFTDETIIQFGDEKELMYRELYKEHVGEIAGLTSLLKSFQQQGIKIGLATMSNKTNVDFILNSLDLRKYFDVWVSGEEVTKGKPDPEIFNLILKKLNLQAQDCVVFEDSISGVKAACNAHLKVIGVTTTISSEALINSGCDRTVNDFRDFKI